MLKNYITSDTLSITIAVVLLIITVLMGRTVYYLFFVKDKRKNMVEKSLEKKAGNSFERCELNDIMGYDFIQIKTIERKEEKTSQEGPKSFADSKGIGLTSRMGTTGKDGYIIDDEPVSIKDEKTDKLNAEKKKEIMTEEEENTNDADNFFTENDWSDKEIDTEEKDKYMNYLTENIPADEFADMDENDNENDDEGIQGLEEGPKEPEQYDDIMNKSYCSIDELEDYMNATPIRDNQSDILSKMMNIGKERKNTNPSEKYQIDNNDLPDID